MTACQDYIYCSALLPVLSLEAVEAARGEPYDAVDTSDDPETALFRKRDLAALDRWIDALRPDLGTVARGVLDGETQAAIARRLRVSEPAVTKRMRRLAAAGRADLGFLRRSALLA